MTRSPEHLDDGTLSALLDGQLTPSELADAEAHLAECQVCQARLNGFRELAALLRALPDLEAPRDFSLGPRPVVDPPNVVRLRRWYTATRVAAASLAAAFVFLSAGALYVDSRPAASFTSSSTPQLASAPAPINPNAPATVSARAAAAPAASPVASPAVGAAPAAARPAPQNQSGQPDDQHAAATNVGPLPTLVPTPAPTARPLIAPLVAPAATADPGMPLRAGALAAGALAVLALLTALVVRHRLSRSTPFTP